MSSSSRIFVRNRALGYVSNHVPVVPRYIKKVKNNFFVTCVGKSFHIYGTSLRLLSVSDLHPEEITSIAGDSFLIFTAAGNVIYAWKRGTELKHKYEGHECPIKLMLPFDQHLISIDESGSLKLWDIKKEESQLDLQFNKDNFEVTTLMHPSTYMNKVLLGSEQGALQLWNLNTAKLIYNFKGWGSGVSVVEQSPALDVVGIGLRNGHIILHNLKYDETIMEFHQDWGMVTSLTFRLDNSPLMITGTMSGHLVLWNLEDRKVFSQLLHAHEDTVTGLRCLPNEPLMVTSSPDNSLKLWIFDMADGGPRLLVKREGHSLPPTFIRFHGANGHNLLSAGGDSHLRMFNTRTERFNKSLGKASYNRKFSKKKRKGLEDPMKMPPIVRFTFETTREKEWDNIAAIHLGVPEVTTWSFDKVKMGELKLIHERFVRGRGGGKKFKGTPTCVHLTHCGNFVLIGYSSGHCDRYNIQSGAFRATYGQEVAHGGAVRGVTTDNLNLQVITGGSDKALKWWNFRTESSGSEVFRLDLEEGVSFFAVHGESSLTAVALEDFTILVIDNEGRNVVRKFEGHTGKLMDAAFSPDSRWLITAGMDCCIFTWDIPSGCLIDHFKVESACTSLSFSPTGELLATTHVEYLGVFLWTNRTLYNHVSLKPVRNLENIPTVAFPSVTQETAAVSEEEEPEEEVESPEQIEGLVTLSGLASSRWQNLLSMDVITKRNKPKEPLQVSQTAPFFLPTVPSMDVTFDLTAAQSSDGSRVLSSSVHSSLTAFGSLVRKAEGGEDFRKIFDKLKSMGPSMIEHEISSLAAADADLRCALLGQFMKMIQFVLNSSTDFELAQAYLGLFLKVHGEALIESHALLSQLEDLKSSQESGWQKLENNLLYNLSVIEALKI